MSRLKNVGIIGIGSYVPEKVLTNFDLEKMVDTNDEWIRTRTGISERRIAEDYQATSDLAYEAAKKAIEDAGIDKDEIGLLVVATMTPDHLTPSTACILQEKLGLKNAGAFDLGAACSGFVYAMVTASNFIATGAYKNVLVVGAETLSKVMNWEDRNTCIIFGDGAGAVVLGEVEAGEGIISSHFASDGSGASAIEIAAGGSRNPASEETVKAKEHFMTMAGQEVFKFAVKAIPDTVKKNLEKADMNVNDIDLFVPHQANYRIIDSAAKRLKISSDKFTMNLDKYGNTSGASIPLAMDEAFKSGKIKKGDNVMLVGFGAGLAYASCLFKWSK